MVRNSFSLCLLFGVAYFTIQLSGVAQSLKRFGLRTFALSIPTCCSSCFFLVFPVAPCSSLFFKRRFPFTRVRNLHLGGPPDLFFSPPARPKGPAPGVRLCFSTLRPNGTISVDETMWPPLHWFSLRLDVPPTFSLTFFLTTLSLPYLAVVFDKTRAFFLLSLRRCDKPSVSAQPPLKCIDPPPPPSDLFPFPFY